MPQHLVAPTMRLGGYFLAEVDQGWLEWFFRGVVVEGVARVGSYGERVGEHFTCTLIVGGLVRLVLMSGWLCL